MIVFCMVAAIISVFCLGPQPTSRQLSIQFEKIYEKMQAELKLLNELSKGRKSGEEKGWLTLEAVEEQLGIVHE